VYSQVGLGKKVIVMHVKTRAAIYYNARFLEKMAGVWDMIHCFLIIFTADGIQKIKAR